MIIFLENFKKLFPENIITGTRKGLFACLSSPMDFESYCD